MLFADGFNADAEQFCDGLLAGTNLIGALSSGDMSAGNAYRIGGAQFGAGGLASARLEGNRVGVGLALGGRRWGPTSGSLVTWFLGAHPGWPSGLETYAHLLVIRPAIGLSRHSTTWHVCIRSAWNRSIKACCCVLHPGRGRWRPPYECRRRRWDRGVLAGGQLSACQQAGDRRDRAGLGHVGWRTSGVGVGSCRHRLAYVSLKPTRVRVAAVQAALGPMYRWPEATRSGRSSRAAETQP